MTRCSCGGTSVAAKRKRFLRFRRRGSFLRVHEHLHWLIGQDFVRVSEDATTRDVFNREGESVELMIREEDTIGDTFIQKTRKLYQDAQTQRNLSKLNCDLFEVTQSMTRNIEKVLGVGDRLDHDDLLSIYRMVTPTRFQDMASFKKSVHRCCDDFVAGSSVQYMAFTDVTLNRFHDIDALHEGRTSLPSMVVLYDGREEVMIVKFVPSLLHQMAAARFHDILHEKFINLGVDNRIFNVGSCWFGDPNDRCKEADNAFTMDERHHDEFPSFVVEVGVFESLQMLKSDAHYWLTKSNERTRLVIIVYIDKVSRKILLQRWECVGDGHPRRATVQYSPCPQMIQSLELEDGKPYVGDALEIPAAKVLDTVPTNLPNGEFVIIREELQNLSFFLWTRC
ncbi:hypothetical protein M758_2G194100 [Ceratodon purpureus]|nr:hypothetical protein M758_2G194100 [Ceratodon purpureus]